MNVVMSRIVFWSLVPGDIQNIILCSKCCDNLFTINECTQKTVTTDVFHVEQDLPSLESSSYLNVTLRYLDPFDPETIGPWDAWTF